MCSKVTLSPIGNSFSYIFKGRVPYYILLFIAARPYHVLGPNPTLAFDPLETFPSEALATFSECLGVRCYSQVPHNTSVSE